MCACACVCLEIDRYIERGEEIERREREGWIIMCFNPETNRLEGAEFVCVCVCVCVRARIACGFVDVCLCVCVCCFAIQMLWK